MPRETIDGFRVTFGYGGSPAFTYADAIEFAAQGDAEWHTVCHAMGGSTQDCRIPTASLGEVLKGIAKFAYELTPIADAVNCVSGQDSCLWLLANVVPPLKGLKVIDNAADAAKTAGRACSFGGDTLVLMADGTTKPINQVKVGDEVLATDPETGEQGPRPVTAVWSHRDTVVDLDVEGQIITTTEDHRYYNTTDRQWQRADH